MDLLIFFLIGVCCYNNAQLAKKTGRNALLWGVITLVAFFVAFVFGGVFMVLTMYKGPLDPPPGPEVLQEFVNSHPFANLMVTLIGMGGYLAVRYKLEKSVEAE